MIETIEKMIYQFKKYRGLKPTKIFMIDSELIELKNELETSLFIKNPQDKQLNEVCDLEIHKTCPEIGMHVEA